MKPVAHAGELIKLRLRALRRQPKWLAASCHTSLANVYRWIHTGLVPEHWQEKVAALVDVPPQQLRDLVERTRNENPPPYSEIRALSRAEVNLLISYRCASKRGKEAIEAVASLSRELP